MWEKAGGKTRFKEMKVKREEAKSRAKNKREIARAAEAKRDKEKAVAAQVSTSDFLPPITEWTALAAHETSIITTLRYLLPAPCKGKRIGFVGCRVY